MRQHHISPRAFTHFLCTRCILQEALALALGDFCSLSAVHMTRVALCEKTADVYNNFCIKPNISIITRETRVQERAKHNYLGAFGKWFPLQVAPNWWIFPTLALESKRQQFQRRWRGTHDASFAETTMALAAWCLASLRALLVISVAVQMPVFVYGNP